MTLDLGATETVAAATDSKVPRVGGCGAVVSGEAAGSPVSRHGSLTVSIPPPGVGPVIAVLVARDGAEYLPRALTALAAQTRQPDVVVGVDAGSRDDSRELLAQHLPAVLPLPRSASFGDAVAAALAAHQAAGLDQARDPRPPDDAPTDEPAAAGRGGFAPAARQAAFPGWLWLLHDDCAPAPDALERLLTAVETAPSVAVAGCKHLDWDDDQRILDVGLTTTRSGTRVSFVDRHEVDQGQHDERSDVLAVGTAGMLIRVDVWQRLGGPDPDLTHARDDLDLGRRAHLEGYRVVVVPEAVVAHAAAWATGRRPGHPSWWRSDRRDALHLRLATTALPFLPLLALWPALAMWPRAALHLALRRPGRAVDELLAPLAVWARPDRWLRSRGRARRARRVPRRVVRRLHAGRLQHLRRCRDEVAAWVVPLQRPASEPMGGAAFGADGPDDLAIARRAAACGPAVVDLRGLPTVDPLLLLAVEAGPVPDEALRIPGARGRTRRRRLRFAVAGLLPVLAMTSAAGLAALHRLLGSGASVGPGLLPVPSSAGALWTAATSSWRPSGLGASAVADPLDALLAAASLPVGGVPGRVVDILLLGGLPLAALTGWFAAGALTPSRLVRAWAALFWAAWPPLLAALGAGRVGAVLAHVVLPPAALALARATGAISPCRLLPPGRDLAPCLAPGRHLRWGCVAGLSLTAVLAGAPSLTVAAAVAVLVVAVTALLARRRPLGVLSGLLPTLAVPAGLLLPWWIAVAAEPRLLLAQAGTAGASRSGFSDGVPVGAAADLARSVPVLAHLGPLALAAVTVVLLTAPAVLAGSGAVLRRGTGAVATAALLAGLAGLATALVSVRVEIAAAGSGLDGGEPLTGHPGPGLSLLGLGLLTAAVALLRAGRHCLRPRRGRQARGPAARHPQLSRLMRAATVTLAALGCLTGPLAVLGGWGWQGVAGRDHAASRWAPAVHRAPADVLPAVAADEAEGEAAARTLVLRADRSQVRWTLARAAGPRLGDDSAALAALRLGGREGTRVGEATVVAPALSALLGDGSADARDRLAELGVGWVLLSPPVEPETALALDASPGLTRVTTVRGAVLWRVDLAAQPGAPTRAARARLVDQRGVTVSTLASRGNQVDVTIPAGDAPRFVVLTERADHGWWATLDGRPLRSLTTSGWAQCFELPAAGGRLRLDHDGGWPGLVIPVQVVVAVLALVGSVPLPGLRRRVAAPAPPAPSRPVPRAAIAGPAPDQLPPMPRVFDADHPEDGDVVPLFSDEAEEAATPEAESQAPQPPQAAVGEQP